MRLLLAAALALPHLVDLKVEVPFFPAVALFAVDVAATVLVAQHFLVLAPFFALLLGVAAAAALVLRVVEVDAVLAVVLLHEGTLHRLVVEDEKVVAALQKVQFLQLQLVLTVRKRAVNRVLAVRGDAQLLLVLRRVVQLRHLRHRFGKGISMRVRRDLVLQRVVLETVLRVV